MEDKINKEPPEQAGDSAPEKVPETPVLDIEKTDTNPEPASMEVHHHSHPGNHHSGRKNWRNHLWEFLMLFLAVFCGFLAEYQLEHTIETQREKKYMESLISDLTTDQEVIARHILTMKWGIAMMDTMTTLLNNPSLLAGNTGQLYYLSRRGPRLNPLATSTRTFEQLKNSGNFRLIKKLEVSNKIMTYYEKFPLIRMLESINETEFTEYKKTAAKIFKSEVFISLEGDGDQINRINSNPALRTMDNELLQELSMYTVYLHGTKKGLLNADEILKTTGLELIAFLKKEYHLK